MGSSLYAAAPAAYHLESCGIAAETIDASELLHYRHAALRPGTLVVLISRSGETVEAIRLLPLLRAAGVQVVCVTNVAESTLAREAPRHILVNGGNDRMVAAQSYTAGVAMLMLLAMTTTGTQAFPAPDALIQGLALAIDREIAEAAGWTEFLAAAPMIYLMGRGPSLGSVYEGALLFNESAQTPSCGMSVAQFRHGPVEVADAQTRAIVFASQPATHDLDQAFADDLRGLRAQVRVCTAGSTPSLFEPVVEIVPIQIAACALALSKGLDPGDFRYATQVTATESGFRTL
jgi:glucosamine--fructose-6-phosphate aminotransferase (isomerizing)